MVNTLTSRVAFLFLTLACLAIGLRAFTAQGERARAVPAPAVDSQPSTRATEVAVFAGGCFWGVQGVYQHVKGVTGAVSGYAGGDRRTADYDLVSSGQTSHAEAVEITFDPRVITYGRLLQVFFSVVHDPTQLNRQGPDVGPQYRSAIFPLSEEQDRVARAFIAQLDRARVFDRAIVTKIEPKGTFYRGEAYHQDFLVKNPGNPYIAINDLPKVENLKRMFAEVYRDAPVLVGSSK